MADRTDDILLDADQMTAYRNLRKKGIGHEQAFGTVTRTRTSVREQFDTAMTRPEPVPGDDGRTDSRKPVPATSKKRLTSEQIAELRKQQKQKETSKTGDTGRLLINHLEFIIPPEQINIQRDIKNVAVAVLRANASQRVRTGHGFVQVSIPLTFNSLFEINQRLVPLVKMARRYPFFYVENKYLRRNLMPDAPPEQAMYFVLQSLNVQSVEGLPTTFQCFMQLMWFNYRPFVPNVRFRRDFYVPSGDLAPDQNPPNRAGEYGNFYRQELNKLDYVTDAKGRAKIWESLQVPVKTPKESEGWRRYMSIGESQENQLIFSDKLREWGPDVPPETLFSWEWPKYYQGENIPQGYTLVDPAFNISKQTQHFYGSDHFNLIHVNCGFMNKIATLPLLEQDLPTMQFLGSTDRIAQLTFFVTQEGQYLLEEFQRQIKQFEHQVIEYRGLTKDVSMIVRCPLMKIAGLFKVIPESVNIETVPGNPGSSIVRVTLSEWNPTSFSEPYAVAGNEDRILKAFVQAVLDDLSEGRPNDIIGVESNPERRVTQIDVLAIGEASIELSRREGQFLILKISGSDFQSRRFAMIKDMVEAVNRLPSGFSFADDEQVFGLKTSLGMSLFRSGELNEHQTDDLGEQADELKIELKGIIRGYLESELKNLYPNAYNEYDQNRLDLNPCYPDLDLPDHPMTGNMQYPKKRGAIDTQPDFFIYNPELDPTESAHKEAEKHSKQQLEIIHQLVLENNMTQLVEEISPKKVMEYRNRAAPVSLKDQPRMDHLTDPNIISQDRFDSTTVGVTGEVGTISEQTIWKTGIKHMKEINELGLKRAFPAFRIHFVKEGINQITYNGFQEAYGGFAVNEIRLIDSRKIPAATCVIQLANLDGFIKTETYNDIRREDRRFPGMSLDRADKQEYAFQFDQDIDLQLLVFNAQHSTNVSAVDVRKLIELSRTDRRPNEFGAMGITTLAARDTTGKEVSAGELEQDATNIRIGVDRLCEIQANFGTPTEQASVYYHEVVAALFKFPDLEDEIRASVSATSPPGTTTVPSNWAERVQSSELQNFAKKVRTQDTFASASMRSDMELRRTANEERIADLQEELIGPQIDVGEASITIDVGAQRKAEVQEQLAILRDENKKLNEELKSLERADPAGRGMIFKEGTDVVLRLGYSQDPEDLEVVFVGHVTEAQPGPGTVTLICQSFATEFVMEIKGQEEDMTMAEPLALPIFRLPVFDVDAPKIVEWITNMKEIKHFGRWEWRSTSPEERQNVRGSSIYRRWGPLSNPADDNCYVESDSIFDFDGSRFTLNDRTLWQGLQDLVARLPGYVMHVRPYKETTESGIWWRNTLFIGRPDYTYLVESYQDPGSANRDRQEIAKIAASEPIDPIYFADASFVATDVTIDPKRAYLQKELSGKIAELNKDRRQPFRRYHMITSYHDIVDNAISTSKRHVYNAVRMRGRGSRQFFERKMEGMDERNQRWLYLENDNASGKAVGKRMVTSVLMTALKDVYRGEITILGNPKIRPYDIVFLMDNYNDFSGPVEVEQVVHTISPQTGFLTQIVPDLYNTISDIVTQSNLGALGTYAYRRYLQHAGVDFPKKYETEVDKYLRANRGYGGMLENLQASNTEDLFKGSSLLLMAGLAAKFPLVGVPLIVGGYFLGGYLKDHASIRIVPLMHKGVPYVTGLQGFEAPRSMDILLNQWRRFAKQVSEDIDDVFKTVDDLTDQNKIDREIEIIGRKIIGG